jgi:hypothetical protein
MTHTTTFQTLHFTFSRIPFKSTTLLQCTPPTKKRVLTHCKLCLTPLNCTTTLSVKRIYIYSETAIHCSHMCHFLQVLLISLGPKKITHIKQCIIISDVSFVKMSVHHTSHSVFQEPFVLTHNIPRVCSSCSISLDYIHVTIRVYNCYFIHFLQASTYSVQRGPEPKLDEG